MFRPGLKLDISRSTTDKYWPTVTAARCQHPHCNRQPEPAKPYCNAISLRRGNRAGLQDHQCRAEAVQAEPPDKATVLQAKGRVIRVSYVRHDNKYEGWGLHVWGDVKNETCWTAPLEAVRSKGSGLTWQVELVPDQSKNNFNHWVGFLIHKGEEKDAGGDVLEIKSDINALYFVSGRKAPFDEAPDLNALPPGDLTKAAAHWVEKGVLAWRVAPEDAQGQARSFHLHWSHSASLQVTGSGVDGMDGSIKLTVLEDADLGDAGDGTALKRFPHLDGCTPLKLPGSAETQISQLLKAQLAVTATAADGSPVDATGLQLQGVLDHAYYYSGPLGNKLDDRGNKVSICVWAPTAQHVQLLLWEGPHGGTPQEVGMAEGSHGEWSCQVPPEWTWKYYTYRLRVFSPWSSKVETFEVTDPYSHSLAADGARTQIMSIEDPSLYPLQWDTAPRPPPLAFTDISVYELHIRDFSASDQTCSASHRGKYLAFAEPHSLGVAHLRELQAAGLTHVHLLPSFDYGSVPERFADQQVIQEDLTWHPPDSEAQQAAVSAIAASDAFNWGYDPVHWSTPEGSYASNPDGPARITEYRLMVQALHGLGLRVVFDTVYNHTFHSGVDGVHSRYAVFDKLVPGYYHRRSEQGDLCTSACCNNTAPEHAMLERLIIEDAVHWIKHYKIDGFRFDIMGHLMLSTMVKLRDAIYALTPEKDGIDGRTVYIYGEGWDFGEVSCNQRGRNACQLNLGGTGLGSFNDRFRDAMVGGSPFGPPQFQGFATGLSYQPNAFTQANMTPQQQLGLLLEYTDLICLGLAGNLKDFVIENAKGQQKTGRQLQYGVQPAGYANEPWECVNYTSCHDGEILFDQMIIKAADELPLSERIRAQRLAIALVALSQGVAFFHAGDELLRSKSLDRDSYNSGDWFNKLDFSLHGNNYGVGLPPAGKNQTSWSYKQPLLANAALKPGRTDILASNDHFLEFLKIRYSTPLLRLPSAENIRQQLSFGNTGPNQVPGVIVMMLASADVAAPWGTTDESFVRILIIANARPQAYTHDWPQGVESLQLHPVLAESADDVVREEARVDRSSRIVRVPGRTVAVFVEPR